MASAPAQPGFYWVRPRSVDPWTVGHFDGRWWVLLVTKPETWTCEEVHEVGAPIPRP